MKKLAFVFGILIICITACKSKKKVTEQETVKTEIAPKMEENNTTVPPKKELGQNLTGKRWKAIEIMGQPVEMPEGMKQEPFLTFRKDGSIAAHGGCNGVFGEYKLGMKNFIDMTNFIQTEMACEFSSFEESLVEALTMGKQYILTGEDNLQIVVGKRAPLAKFEAVYLD